jgi:hypothetical protein
MGKKTGKRIACIVAAVTGVLILLSLSFYLPVVQRLVKNRVVSIVSRATGLQVNVERFRLRFPANLFLYHPVVLTPKGDTLLQAGRIDVDVAFCPLLSGKIRVRRVALSDVGLRYADSLSTIGLTGRWKDLSVESLDLSLKRKEIGIGRIRLSGADAELDLSKPSAQKPPAQALWRITVNRIELDTLSFRMRARPETMNLEARLPQGEIRRVGVDLGARAITVGALLLNGGTYTFLSTAPTAPESKTEAGTTSPPWDIRLDRLELDGNGFRSGVLNGVPEAGFDPRNLWLEPVDAILSGLYYRANDWGGTLETLAFVERCGFTVTEGRGVVACDAMSLTLNGFELKTQYSTVSADLRAAIGRLSRNPATPLSLTLQAELDPRDISCFYTPSQMLRRVLTGGTLRIDGEVDGSLSRMNICKLSAALPERVDLTVHGNAVDLLDPERRGGKLTLGAEVRDPDLWRSLFPDSLRRRIGFPRRMSLSGTVGLSTGTYASDLRITADRGMLTVKGNLNPGQQRYDAAIHAEDFPLSAFLPADSLGLLSLDLTAAGAGFDPRRTGARTDLKLTLDRLDYRAHTYRKMALNASLADRQWQGRLIAADTAAAFDLVGSGTLSAEEYTVRLTGRIDTLDGQRLGLSAEPFDLSLGLDAEAVMRPDTAYRADLRFDSIRWAYDNRTQDLPLTTLTASSDSDGVSVGVRSGNLTFDLLSPVRVDSLIRGLSRTSGVLRSQIDSLSLDMAALQAVVPPFAMQASAGRDNVLHAWMRTRGWEFDGIEFLIATMYDEPLQGMLALDRIETGGLRLDTLYVLFRGEGERLNYGLRLANRPGNPEQFGLLVLSGFAARHGIQADLYQRNRADSVGFRIGLNAEWLDRAVRLRITSENPRLGYTSWSVNPDNYLLYRFDRTFDANLRLEASRGRHLYLSSSSLEPSLHAGALRLDLRGIDVAPMLELLPSTPPLGGVLNTEASIGFDRGQFVGRGNATVDGLTWKQRRVGDLGANLDFQSDSLNRYVLDGGVTVGGRPVLKAGGTYFAANRSLDFRVSLSALPLSVANGFLPERAVRLAGSLTGAFSAAGPAKNLRIDGQLNFAEGIVELPVIGTSYTLSDTPILFRQNLLDLNRFSIFSPGRQPLTLDGTIDLGSLSRITADLSATARNFEVVDASSGSGSMLYGKALANLALTARGPVDALTVRGDVALLRGTDVTYTVRNDGLPMEHQKQDWVAFVDFADPVADSPTDSTGTLRLFGVDALVNIGIEENIRATVNLSESGGNRGEISGSGNMTYTLNTQGDSRFTGDFNIASGRILYTPPLIAAKDFKISEGSRISWTGDLLDPIFEVTAVEPLRTTVSGSGSDAALRNVSFDVSIRLRNSLKKIEVLFDLAAPGDEVIQPQLAAMTPEQRSRQAMALLLYNTYTGPGTTAVGRANNPLNAFIARELNQWTRNNLPGVDLTFGIDRSTDSGGGSSTDYSYQMSKSLFNDRVKVTVGGSINSDAETDKNLQENFVKDIVVEYRLTERDNMYLKAYRYNTRESILEGEVVETGGGFLLRRRMNRLSDFFKSLPREERRELRAVARAARREKRGGELQQILPSAGVPEAVAP